GGSTPLLGTSIVRGLGARARHLGSGVRTLTDHVLTTFSGRTRPRLARRRTRAATAPQRGAPDPCPARRAPDACSAPCDAALPPSAGWTWCGAVFLNPICARDQKGRTVSA